MASQAAIDGIMANGLSWKTSGPSIRGLCKSIGKMRDGDVTDPAVIVRTVHALGSEIKRWMASLSAEEFEDFDRKHGESVENMQEITVEDVEVDATSEIEEVVCALEDIYDTFDYNRVLVR